MTIAEKFRKAIEIVYIRNDEIHRGVITKEIGITFEDDSKVVLIFDQNYLQYIEATGEKDK